MINEDEVESHEDESNEDESHEDESYEDESYEDVSDEEEEDEVEIFIIGNGCKMPFSTFATESTTILELMNMAKEDLPYAVRQNPACTHKMTSAYTQIRQRGSDDLLAASQTVATLETTGERVILMME